MQALAGGSRAADRGPQLSAQCPAPRRRLCPRRLGGGQLPVDGLGDSGDPRRRRATQTPTGAEAASAPDYLSAQQASDGHYRYSGSSDQTPIWVTGQVLVAASGDSLPVPVAARAPKPPPQPTSPAGNSSPPTSPGSTPSNPLTIPNNLRPRGCPRFGGPPRHRRHRRGGHFRAIQKASPRHRAPPNCRPLPPRSPRW